MKLRKEVLWFARQMEAKLRENDHKSHWSEEKPGWLFRRLQGETGELNWELFRFINPKRDAIIAEAADVANFAMMIADNTRNEMTK